MIQPSNKKFFEGVVNKIAVEHKYLVAGNPNTLMIELTSQSNSYWRWDVSLLYRIVWCWKMFTKGTVWNDTIWMTPNQVRELGWYLLAISTKATAVGQD